MPGGYHSSTKPGSAQLDVPIEDAPGHPLTVAIQAALMAVPGIGV